MDVWWLNRELWGGLEALLDALGKFLGALGVLWEGSGVERAGRHQSIAVL